MILPFYWYKQTCASGEDLTIEQAIEIVAAFLFYYKGAVLNTRYVVINDIEKFERMVTVACNYFIRMPFPYQA